jgi:hypothetical protein
MTKSPSGGAPKNMMLIEGDAQQSINNINSSSGKIRNDNTLHSN